MQDRRREYVPQFYMTSDGTEPAAKFIDSLAPDERAALVAAIDLILSRHGAAVCEGEFGKALGKGLFEFRLRKTYDEIVQRYPGEETGVKPPDQDRRGEILLRLYFHPHGDKLILLLCGYNKRQGGQGKREQKAIKQARKYLRDFKREKDSERLRRGLSRWVDRKK